MQNTFANECFMDELAAAAGADPIEFRVRYLDPSDRRGIEALERVAALAKWEKRPARGAEAERSAWRAAIGRIAGDDKDLIAAVIRHCVIARGTS